NEGTLYLTNCAFLGNSSGTGGALSVQTPAPVINCTFSDNISTNGAGGGIANYDTLTLNNCSFFANSVTNDNGQGGGLLNSGILTMNNCTLYGNSTPNGSGGGIYNADTLTAANCTLADNAAANGSGGGLASFTATNVLINCTISSNSAAFGGGVVAVGLGSSAFALTNTVVAGNAAAQYPDFSASYSGAANFIGGNPELAAPGAYGGVTETMPPLYFSPLIDAGTDWVTNILAADQRGYPRLAGRHVDIGAVETQPAPANNSPILRDTAWSSNGGEFATGTFRFSFTNVPNADFTVFSSTNLWMPLNQWTVLGNARQVFFPGLYEFFAPVAATVYFTRTNYTDIFPPRQFYRVVSP
ncbi:MAG: choice-of-anchor Q domain-containing protein, partial [Limisphaerales bacterium]